MNEPREVLRPQQSRKCRKPCLIHKEAKHKAGAIVRVAQEGGHLQTRGQSAAIAGFLVYFVPCLFRVYLVWRDAFLDLSQYLDILNPLDPK